ncbi:hypothetical protein [Nocardia sp. NPDC046763]|uniref:hypothetical protein n=1 Tax=Nocardia sp. NPDC046763 TaxID=3155256 RepID=UPI0033E14A70
MHENLGYAGEKLWNALESDAASFETGVLVLEACRIADRLEHLARILDGDTDIWARIAAGRDGELEIRVDGALQEARQQAGTLRQLLAAIAARRGAPELDDEDGLADL